VTRLTGPSGARRNPRTRVRSPGRGGRTITGGPDDATHFRDARPAARRSRRFPRGCPALALWRAYWHNVDGDDWLIGAQAHLPLSRSIELYPSFDYYFVDPGSVVGLNADLQFRTPGAPLYLGGGLNILKTSGNSDTGFDLFGGLETRYGRTHPYLELRGIFHDNSSVQLVAGLNVTLY